MKRFISIFILVGFFVVGCGPSAEEQSTQTSIAFTETAAVWTRTPTSTQTPTATLEPTNTPTPTPDPNVYQPQTACDLPYAPLRSGSRPEKAFVIGEGLIDMGDTTIIEVTGDNNHASAVLTTDNGEWGRSESSIKCDSTGIVIAGGTSNGFKDSGKTKPERSTLVSFSGLAYPPADQWKVGFTWESCKETQFDGGVGYTEDKGLVKTCTTSTISSQEMVEVEGKMVEVLRVETIRKEITNNLTYSHSCLYAYGIGRISCE